MEQTITMRVNMTDEPNEYCMMVTPHQDPIVNKSVLAIHGLNCPVTLDLNIKQAFNLMVELKSALREFPLEDYEKV